MVDEREYPLKFRSIYFQLRAKKFYEDVFNLEVIWYIPPR